MKQLSLAIEPAATKQRVRRRGAPRPGPKARAEREGFMQHRAREEHDARHPVHVTMRRVPLAPSFRAERVSRAIMHEIAVAKANGVRVIQQTIQDDHLHVIVEGQSAADLSAQMRKLFWRIALVVNAIAGRRGSLFRDRHHRHALKTPREVRNALVYVLFNSRKHGAGPAAEEQAFFDAPDPLSSAPWFRDWDPNARPPPEAVLASQRGVRESPLSRPETWLARAGWKRAGGPIRFDEQPRRPR